MKPRSIIRKLKMSIGEAKDIENALAMKEKYEAFMDYIAACDHPEILEEEGDTHGEIL